MASSNQVLYKVSKVSENKKVFEHFPFSLYTSGGGVSMVVLTPRVKQSR